MRAKTLKENMEFKRGQEPKNALGLGMTPEKIPTFLERFGIDSHIEEDTHEPGIITLNTQLSSNLRNFQISYVPENSDLHEEYGDWGWGITDQWGSVIKDAEGIKDAVEFIKKLLKIEYPRYQSIIKSLEENLAIMKNVAEFIDES